MYFELLSYFFRHGRNEKSPLRALTHVLAKDREEYGASRNEKSPLRALTPRSSQKLANYPSE